MKRMAWIPWALISLIIVLTPMAWASPIDPAWTTSYYDDADLDDVVLYLTSSLLATSVLPVNHAVLGTAFVLAHPVLEESPPPSPLGSAHSPRAPPLA